MPKDELGYRADVILDSVSPLGHRLTTMVWRYPRFIHAEIMTHRMLSRNSSSSRAIPNAKLVNAVITEPARPVYWGKNQRGMQADEELSPEQVARIEDIWFDDCRQYMVGKARQLSDIGLHKQLANRIIEPWMWIEVVISATNGWANLFALRDHPKAQPEFRHVARMARLAMAASRPRILGPGEWHLPFVTDEERGHFSTDEQKKLATARCARVSYLTHEGVYDPGEDMRLYGDLSASDPMHASAFEHVATPTGDHEARGNFRGWLQHRKEFPNEYVEDELYDIREAEGYEEWLRIETGAS